MRLLQCHGPGNYSLTSDLSPGNAPPYAILSHTWGSEEVVFSDLAKTPGDWQHKAGYGKIEFCADQARRHGLQYFWVDTCCIDKSDSIELQTAINSMFRWYRDAKRCYVYLSDVSGPSASGQRKSMAQWSDAFRQSRWFTRGWTLQELIAPKTVDFYSKKGVWLGDKQSLEPMISEITGIPMRALCNNTPIFNFSVSEREAWIRDRQTKYEEDMAYSLLGIFNVHMPLIYGEGREKALRRLREEVQKTIQGSRTNDFSVTFSLSEVPKIQYFFARQSEIAEIRRKLRSDGTRCTVVLHGLGGIGKTQLAARYIERYRDEHSAIFWFNIKDESSIHQSFIKVARQILQQHPTASGLSALDLQQNHDEVVEAVKAWLSLPGNTRWLAVYDNYDNPKLTNHKNNTGIDINRFLPMAYQGSIIITTRVSQVDIGHSMRIKKLESTEDSLNILSSTSGRNNLRDGKVSVDMVKAVLRIAIDADAEKLIKRLDGLPLALATAGAYLRRVSISLAEYLRLYKISWARLHTSTPSLGSYEDRTLCSTWQVSYRQVQEQNPLAAHLLRWWAYFDNEDIWFELLQFVGEIGPDWLSGLADELNFNSAMGTLHDYGFVEAHAFGAAQVESNGYSIHGCLHSWTVHILNTEWDVDLGKLAVMCIALRVPSEEDNQFWLLQKRLMPHAIVSSAALHDGDEGLSVVLHNLGNLYLDQGKLEDAEKMYLRALRGYEKAVGPDHTSTLDTVNNLGNLYIDQGMLQEAEKMLIRALRGYEKAVGPDHTSTLDTVNNLGNLYKDQGMLQEAEKMYLRALRGYEKAVGPDHTSTLDTVNNLGNLHIDQGMLQEAEKMLLRALRGYEKAVGPDHTSTLDTVNNLGNLYKDQGMLQEAEKMYLRALRGKEKAVGPDHTSTLAAVTSLGILYMKQGKLQDAEKMFSRAFHGYEKAIGCENITRYRPAINAMRNLGELLRKQDRLIEARGYFQRAYSGLKGLLGQSHQDVQSLQRSLLDLNRAIEVRSVGGDRLTPRSTQARMRKRRKMYKRKSWFIARRRYG